MKFCCITPCLNAERYLEQTMLSVLTQDAWYEGHALYYRIQDGGSSDGTIELARDVAREYHNGRNLHVEIESVADDGMYDALAKAWDRAPEADAYHYLNAGDLVTPSASSVVARALLQNEVDWVTGMHVIINDSDAVVRASLPFDYSPRLFYSGVYGRLLPHIQQESTFWTHQLHRTIDLSVLRQFRLAGDQFVWSSFFRWADLYTLRAFLGAFRKHKGQLSERFADEYLTEAERVWSALSPASYPLLFYHLFMGILSDNMRARASRRLIIEDVLV